MTLSRHSVVTQLSIAHRSFDVPVRESLGDRHTDATATLVGALEETGRRGWDRIDAGTRATVNQEGNVIRADPLRCPERLRGSFAEWLIANAAGCGEQDLDWA
jgi:hypothetical protein